MKNVHVIDARFNDAFLNDYCVDPLRCRRNYSELKIKNNEIRIWDRRIVVLLKLRWLSN
jgi:hypothetical protein